MLKFTTRAGAGDGTALITAAAGERLRIGDYVFLQLMEAGEITVILKFGSTQVHSPILLKDASMGTVLKFPHQTSAPGEALYVNLSANDIDVSVTVDVDKLSY